MENTTDSIAYRLRRLRETAGLSLKEAALAIGKTLAGYQHYENPQRFKSRYLPLEIVEPLARTVAARGIAPEPWYELAGIRTGRPASADAPGRTGLIAWRPPPGANRRARAVETLIDGRAGWVPYVVQDRAVDRRGYLPGDIVVIDRDAAPSDDSDVVAVHYREADTGASRLALRVYRPPFVLCASRDERWDAVIDLVDNARVRIEGVAVAGLRLPGADDAADADLVTVPEGGGGEPLMRRGAARDR